MKTTMFAGVLAAPLLMFAMSQGVYADDATPTTCKDGTTSSAAGRGACSGHGGVQKAPKTTAAAPAPAAAAPAVNPSMTMTAATKTCKDGTASAATGKGACSGHGGVQKTPTPATPAAATPTAATAPAAAPAPAAPATTPAPAPTSAMKAATKSAPTVAAGNTDPTGATAKCKDGTYSKSQHHSGTCSSHGGVAQWLTAAQ